MNKLLISFIAITIATVSFGAITASKSKSVSKPASKPEVITLTKRNTLALRGVVTASSVRDVEQKFLTMSNSLSKNDTIYLFLDTPGGSVDAGMNMVASLRAAPQEVKTITNFAASMGFVTVQNLGERLILPNGTLMAHRATAGAQGQIPGELNSRVAFFTNSMESIEEVVAARLGITHEKYAQLINSEYWTEGAKAVKENSADKVVLISCDSTLEGTTTEKLATLFGTVDAVWSDCPTIVTPLNIDFSGLAARNATEEEELVKVKKIIYDGLMDKNNFLNDSSFRAAYLKYVN